jgi:hypothetical protein
MLESKILSSSHTDALFLNWPTLTRTHEKLAEYDQSATQSSLMLKNSLYRICSASTLNQMLKIDGTHIFIGQLLGKFVCQSTAMIIHY